MRLIADRHVLQHHSDDLQHFDLLTQRLDCLAEIWEAQDIVEAVEQCPLEDLSTDIVETLHEWDRLPGGAPTIARKVA